jgi:predicted DNA binding CopG/RHH family protein
MKKKTQYTDEPLGRVKKIKDFLPPPEELVPREEQVKVTISLSRKSVDFFKKAARKNRIPYQRMIREVLDRYTEHFGKTG